MTFADVPGGTPAAPFLDIAEAVPLGYALVSRVAERSGVRLLAIKGPVLEQQGLRESHRSIDVDVLVDPSDRDGLVAELGRLGWGERVVQTAARVLPLHSVTLAHPAWPCELDVHHEFPGFFEPASVTFETLWADRSEALVAGRTVACTSPSASAVIMALHLLRDPDTRGAELVDLVQRCRALDDVRIDTVAALARRTGGEVPLQPFLEGLGVWSGRSVDVPERQLAAWEAQGESRQVHGVGALYQLSTTPWRRRPALVWRSLWLTESEIREAQPDAAPGWRGLAAARAHRLGLALRDLPRAAGVIRRSTR